MRPSAVAAHDDEAVELGLERPARDGMLAAEERVDDRCDAGGAESVGPAVTGVVKCDRAARPDVGMPHLPVLPAALRGVVAVDEHEVDGRPAPGAPDVLGAGDVPADPRAASAAPEPPDRAPGGERRGAPAAGQRGPALDERVDEVQFALRAERSTEQDRRGPLVDADLDDARA